MGTIRGSDLAGERWEIESKVCCSTGSVLVDLAKRQ